MSRTSSFFDLINSSSPASRAAESAPPETATITELLSGNSRLRQAINSRRANALNRIGLAKDFDFGDGDLGVIDFVIAAYARARARGQPICGILALIVHTWLTFAACCDCHSTNVRSLVAKQAIQYAHPNRKQCSHDARDDQDRAHAVRAALCFSRRSAGSARDSYGVANSLDNRGNGGSALDRDGFQSDR